jgi:hypothetical protein
MAVRIILAVILTILLVKKAYSASTTEELKEFANTIGYVADPEVFSAIQFASDAYKVSAYKLLIIAATESSLNHDSVRVNKNGTKDLGLFQINDVTRLNECKDYDVHSLIGNALCAAKLIRMHKRHAKTDPFWVGRYHSKTPSKKKAYYQKLVKIAGHKYVQ